MQTIAEIGVCAELEKGAKSVEAGRECPPILRDEGGMTETWATSELMPRPLDECLFIHSLRHLVCCVVNYAYMTRR